MKTLENLGVGPRRKTPGKTRLNLDSALGKEQGLPEASASLSNVKVRPTLRSTGHGYAAR